MANRYDPDDIERRTLAAGFQDGLIDLFGAAVLVSIALMWAVSPVFVGVLSALVVLYGWRAVEKVKERITYPRLGYFRERPEEPRTTGGGILIFLAVSVAIMVTTVAVFGDLTEAASWRRAAPLLSGLSLAGGFWYTARRSGFLRHRLAAAFSVVTGVVLWATGSGADYRSVVWHLLGLSALLTVSGGWGLARFLRTHPVQDSPSDA